MPETMTAGAMPAVADATSTQTTPVSPAADPTAAPATPATGDSDALGDAGKRALEAERTARKTAEKAAAEATKRVEELENATKTDTEKAIAEAKKEGNLEATTKLTASIRRSEVKAALTAAGVNAALLDLAIRADEFAALEVDADGEVRGLDTAVDAFRKSHPDVFKAPVQVGSSDGGTRGTARITKDQVSAWSKDPAEYDKHRDQILDWMSQGQH
jgi:hypothetical protein